jgi:predicted AlkP superfamily phosphohydrolase/phosphomutase
MENGYLRLKEGKTVSGEWFEGVDWSKTRAYAFGLSGIYVNLKGREGQGAVAREDADALKSELVEKLSGLKDPLTGEEAITTLYDTAKIYEGPYRADGPDLIVGYKPGYRTSWDSVVGKVAADVFIDNEKAWSADHCIDYRFVPGVFFCNRKIHDGKPRLRDMAPTVLSLFGIAAPAYMDGVPLRVETARPGKEQE